MIRALLFPYFYCLFLGCSWAICFKKKFSDSLAPTILLHVMLMVPFTRYFHSVSAGVWGGVIIAGLVLIYKSRSVLQDVRKGVVQQWSSGIFAFTVLYIFCFLINHGKKVLQYEDFVYSGIFLQEAFYKNTLLAELPLPFWHDHVIQGPLPVTFGALWHQLAGRFHETDAYRAVQMLMFSMILPMFNTFATHSPVRSQEIRKGTDFFSGRWLQLVAIFSIIFLLASIKTDGYGIYHSLASYHILGVIFFYCLMVSLQWNGEVVLHTMLPLIIGVVAMVFTNMIGVFLVPMVIVFFFIQSFFYFGNNFKKNDFSQLFHLIFMCTILWYPVYIFLNMPYGGYEGSAPFAMQLLEGEGDVRTYINIVWNNFIESLLNKKISVYGSYYSAIICAVTLVFILAYLKKMMTFKKEGQFLLQVFFYQWALHTQFCCL